MIDVYSWATPNGHKVHIMLEECGLAYRVIPVNIGAGDQFKPEFLAISPNNRIPAITDPDGPDGKPIYPEYNDGFHCADAEPVPGVLLNPTYASTVLGDPLDAAATLNRLQALARVPLLAAGDFEFGP